jgi:hypothetical protein
MRAVSQSVCNDAVQGGIRVWREGRDSQELVTPPQGKRGDEWRSDPAQQSSILAEEASRGGT